MNWSDFLDTASRLALGATEADWRSAVSRAYYAVFHYFDRFLHSHGVSIGRGGNVHAVLYAGLLHCGFPQLGRIASRIDDLRIARGEADYDLGQPLPAGTASAFVREGRAIVADFQALLTGLSPAKVAAGVRRYYQTIGRLPPTP
jgi:hypothetical protein